ncbi:endonuclease [Candidatus Magnetaquicoccus inordinatus]|uniref:endonuclease n=1 Tax=Candidatus Magnetaquicoccus inordinatus TaxID=2496818 RepID=UPI001D0EBEAC|nr:endonuclease [Candidatus Magnetaquicoccus inordinatus]
MKEIFYALIIAALLLAWSHFSSAPTPQKNQQMPVASENIQIPHKIRDFHEAKKLADQIFSDHRETFYCACRYDKQHRIDPTGCGYVARKNVQRGERLEWEHIVPAHAFGGGRICWREEVCQKEGKSFKGRKCCEEQDPLFNAMEGDLHNLVPAVGELNADRGNRPFGLVAGKGGEYGACDFKIDFHTDIVQPRAAVRGDIARTYFYFEKFYHLPISETQRKLFERWDKEDPVDAWERERNRRIKALQGNGNPFVEATASP